MQPQLCVQLIWRHMQHQEHEASVTAFCTNLDSGGPLDDVVVGDDVALLVPHDATASSGWVVLHVCCEGIPPAFERQ